MKFSNQTLQRINGLSILEVADKLEIKYSGTGGWRKALCFIHSDHTPSLGLHIASNHWKCFVCNEGGNQIGLVMKHENLSYLDACRWLCKEFKIPMPEDDAEQRKSLIESTKKILQDMNPTLPTPSSLTPTLLDRFKGTSNEFTRALVNNRILTREQMQHAAEVYHLGTVPDPNGGEEDAVIFWQIDAEGNIREGKVMHYQPDCHRSQTRKPVSISWLLKQQGLLSNDWKASSCLLGSHLIRKCREDGVECREQIIAIVESEKTAVIMSELCPTLPIKGEPEGVSVSWLATGGKTNLSVQALQPLRDMRVILFPDTDKSGATYDDWLKVATDYNKTLPKDSKTFVTVSNILERHATDDQKSRKIDIADFVIESLNPNP